MFSALATVTVVVWILNHKVETVIILAVLVFLVYCYITRDSKVEKKAKREAQERAKAKAAQSALVKAAASRSSAAPAPVAAPVQQSQSKTINIPSEVDGMTMAYHYGDVKLEDPTAMIHNVSDGSMLTLEDDGTRVRVLVGAIHIGYLPNNRLSGMVRDWQRDKKPIRAYLLDASAPQPIIFLGFYDDVLKKFLSRNPEAKKFKLAGRPEDLAFYSVGQKCEIEQDPETGKYNVLVDGSVIGRLPASAVTYASTIESDPDMLDAVIASVDYDVEKDRDIITVYLA